MDTNDIVNRRERLVGMVKRGNTGNASALAKSLGVSRRTFFVDLQALREQGYNIAYDPLRKGFLLKK